MFFYIGKKSPLVSLNQVSETLYLDQGWERTNINDIVVWYKGYSTECKLELHLSDIIDGYHPAGKWAVLVKCNDTITLKQPLHRSFPLYESDDILTNLKLSELKFINADIPLYNVSSTISLSDATYLIGNIVLENIQNFYKFNDIQKMNVLFSGGLDTLTVWALLDNITPMYNLDVYIPKKTDNTSTKWLNVMSEYQSDLIDHVRKNYWGYEISRFYKNKNYNITGFYAERHQLREVTNGLAIAHYLGKSMNDLLETTDYLYYFLNRPDIVEKSKNMVFPDFENEIQLKQHCYGSIAMDYQMWHLDNNFHFSPLFDRRITEVVCRLSVSDMLINLRHGYIQKQIINRFNPKLLPLLADYKNAKDVFGNFKKNWKNVRLNPTTRVTIR